MPYSKLYLESLTPCERREFSGIKTGGIETGHKSFDHAANGNAGYLGTGNVASANQRSSYVRAYDRTRCNGRDFAPGELQNFDLKQFRLPRNVEHYVRYHARDKEIILYELRSPSSSRPGEHVTHGWLLTDEFHRHIVTYSGAAQKSALVMARVAPHLCWNDRDASDPVAAEQILDETREFSAEDFSNFARDHGFETASDPSSCKASGLQFNDEKPYSSWSDEDPAGSMTRAATPGRATALLAIRLGLAPEDIVRWRQAREIDSSPTL